MGPDSQLFLFFFCFSLKSCTFEQIVSINWLLEPQKFEFLIMVLIAHLLPLTEICLPSQNYVPPLTRTQYRMKQNEIVLPPGVLLKNSQVHWLVNAPGRALNCFDVFPVNPAREDTH